jgi:O-antigen biosynthesis protein
MLQKARQLLSRNGWRKAKQRLQYIYRRWREEKLFQKWVKTADTLTRQDREIIRRKINNLKHKPLISILTPVYNVEEKWLRCAVESVRRQLYENWELCLADDNSSSPHVAKILREYAAKDSRIKVVFRDSSGHISAASNSALELAAGEYAALLDHDDELAEHALYLVASEINLHPEADLIYSDEDKIDEKGRRYASNFKPDYSPDLLYSLNLFTHLSVYRTKILKQINGFRLGTEGSQDYDLALRFTEEISENRIRHIPHILYHWRAISGSAALAPEEKTYAHDRAREVLQEHFARKNIKATVSESFFQYHRVSYELPEKLPKVSLISVLDKAGESVFSALENILAKTDYENFEFYFGMTSAAKAFKNLQSRPKLRLEFFNESENNTAANYNKIANTADGEILVFLDGALVAQNPDWLREIVSLALQPKIGAVGAKILNRDETIRNGGVVLGINNLLGFAHRDLPKETDGNLARAQVVNNFSAVSGVVATRREVFENAGGFDAESFAKGLFDVDFCLRLREKNLRAVFTPFAELIQLTDSSTEKAVQNKRAEEIEIFRRKWKHLIENDPFYNVNFSLKDAAFSIAVPPRIENPWKND